MIKERNNRSFCGCVGWHKMDKWQAIENELLAMDKANLRRHITVFNSAQQKRVQVDGQSLLLFSSNSYLDLCADKRIIEAQNKAGEAFGIGSGGSRLTTGTTCPHAELEAELARFKGREAALVFNTGYMANVGTISALANVAEVIFSDELNHASIIDGCRLAGVPTVVYRHNDMADLEQKVSQYAGKTGLIVSDGVFSMDGDIVNLPEMVRIAEKYKMFSMIDEAHATGVIGATGRGTEEYFNMEGAVDVLMGTLSKAIGSEGGFVCGSRRLIDFLLNRARSFIFSTAISPATAAGALRGLQIIADEPQRVRKLQDNIAFFCTELKRLGINAQSKTAVLPVIIGDEGAAVQVMAGLKQRGFYISAIRYPTVARGQARLRITLMSTHTFEELASLAENLAECMQKLR